MTRETVAERAARLRCPDCGKWYMGNAQRAAHAAKVGHTPYPTEADMQAGMPGQVRSLSAPKGGEA